MCRHVVAAAAVLTALGCGDAPTMPSAPPAPEASLVPAEITVVDLGFAAATDLNDLGQVLGSDPTAAGAILWSPVVGITTLPLTRAAAINNLGQVVGDVASHPFLWDPSSGLHEIALDGFSSVIPQDLNDLGQVVGFTVTGSSNLTQEFLWDAVMGLTVLPTVDGVDDVAFAINNAVTANNLGQVVGRSRNPTTGDTHAFLWDPSAGMTDLGTLPGGAFSEALGINDLGQVVGRSRTATGGPCPSCGLDFRPFLWEAGSGMIDLGSFGGSSGATDINNLGQVVGSSVTPTGVQHAFVWEQATGMRDLGTLPDAVASRASAVNDAGQVVGFSVTAQGQTRATLWATLRTATAAEETEILAGVIEDLEASGRLPPGLARALLATLASVSRQLTRGNTAAATDLLEVFIRQVEAFRDAGHLAAADAQTLIDAAQNGIDQLTA